MIKPFDFCPVCESENIIFYDTKRDENSGRYKCYNCGRNTSWAIGKSQNIYDVIKETKHKFKEMEKS